MAQRPARRRRAPPQKRAEKPRDKTSKGAIEFCKRCGSIMIPDKRKQQVVLKCRSCSYEVKKALRDLKIVEEKKATRGIIVIEKDDTILPITDKACEACGHPKAHWWLQQTRSADEPPTQFFRCVKCKHVWREYK